MQKQKSTAPATLRCAKTRAGSILFSPCQSSRAMKAMPSKAKRTSRAMTRPEFHA